VLTESDVVEAVAAYLEAEDYHIASKCSTHERGIDIVAEHPRTKEQLLVEAKAAPVPKMEPPTMAIRSVQTKQKRTSPSRSTPRPCFVKSTRPKTLGLLLAFPDDRPHRLLVENITTALQMLGISVFFVDSSRRVTEIPTATAQKRRSRGRCAIKRRAAPLTSNYKEP
jgi:hypothetical protein